MPRIRLGRAKEGASLVGLQTHPKTSGKRQSPFLDAPVRRLGSSLRSSVTTPSVLLRFDLIGLPAANATHGIELVHGMKRAAWPTVSLDWNTTKMEASISMVYTASALASLETGKLRPMHGPDCGVCGSLLKVVQSLKECVVAAQLPTT